MNCYHLLRNHGLARSKRDFSTRWLGASQNYTCLRGDRPPTPRKLRHLIRRLVEEGRFVLAARIAWTLLREARP